MSHLQEFEELKSLKYDSYSSCTPKEKTKLIEDITASLKFYFDTFDELSDGTFMLEYSRQVTLNGKVYHLPWGGYFDVVENIDIQEVSLQN